MDAQQRQLELDELHATIVKLGAETARTIAERAKIDAEVQRMSAENAKFDVEIRKMLADTNKVRIETIVYPMVAATAFVGAIIALTKLFL